jgi:hypothetical protein
MQIPRQAASMRIHLRTLVTLALLAAGCARDGDAEGGERPAEAPAVAHREAPGAAPASTAETDAACRVDAPRLALAPSAPVVAVGIASGEGGAALAAAEAGALNWVRLDETLAPEKAVRVPFAEAGGLFGVVAWGPRFAALAEGACPSDLDAPRCLHVNVFGRDDAPIGPIAAPINAPMTHLRVAADPELLAVARSSAEGPAVVDLFTLTGDSIAHLSETLATPEYPGELHVEVLAALVHEGRWAVAWRAGATEDPRGAVLLSTPGGTHEAHDLAHAAMLDALAPDPTREGGLVALASFEWHRPRIFRLDPDGHAIGDPVEVPHGARVGPPFGRPEIARLDRDPRGLLLRRSTRGGDRIGEPVLVAPAEEVLRAALTVQGDNYLVAIAAPEAPHAVSVRRLRCSP